MTVEIGDASFYSTFSPRNHGWTAGMNNNMLKAAATLHGAVKSIVSSPPSSPAPNQAHIVVNSAHELHNAMIVWTKVTDAEFYDWHVIRPILGWILHVTDEDKLYVYTNFNTWDVALDLNEAHTPVAREFCAFVPGPIRPNGLIIHHVVTMDLTIPAGAPGCKAFLQTAPVGGNLVLTMNGGNITFPAGSNTGTFNVPSAISILPAEFENLYSRPGVFMVQAPTNTYGAEGLSVTIKAEMRSINAG